MPKGDPWKATELKMPRDLCDVVDVFAHRRGIARSEYIRRTLRAQIEREMERLTADAAADDATAQEREQAEREVGRVQRDAHTIDRARAHEAAARRERESIGEAREPPPTLTRGAPS